MHFFRIKAANIIFPLICAFILAFLFVNEVNAQVVINEFSSDSSDDWVELYAIEDVDISGWILRDTATSIVKTIPQGTTLNTSNSLFFVVEVGNRLNKDGDIIKLLKPDDATIVDQLSYGNEDGVCVPSGGQSVGRYPDSNSVIERFKTPTKGSSNASAELEPCPAPTSEPAATFTPTPTPKPTKNPTNSPTDKPSKTPTPTTKKETSIPTNTVGLQDDTTENEVVLNEDNQTEVLGIQEISFQKISPTPTEPDAGNGKKFPWLAGIFIISGLGLTGAAFYPIFRKGRLRYNLKSEEDKK